MIIYELILMWFGL